MLILFGSPPIVSTRCVSSVGLVFAVLLYTFTALRSELLGLVQETKIFSFPLDTVKFVGTAGVVPATAMLIFTLLV